MKSKKIIGIQYEEAIKFHQLPYNHQETLKLQSSSIYIKYKTWLKDNGVIIDPRLRYPSYFGSPPHGIVGISCIKPIQRNKAIIAVPYNLLITVDKVRQNKDVNFIIKDSSINFSKKDDIVLKILMIYVIYEMLKGQKSFYYHYFTICANDYSPSWQNWTPYKLQHRGVMKDLKNNQQQIQLQFMKFLSIFRQYDKIFPQNITNIQYKELFNRAYYLVTTRAFGWSLPSISLIPLADSLNHGNCRYLNHFLTNLQYEKNGKSQELNFHTKINLSIFKDQFFNPNNEKLAIFRKQPKNKCLKFIQKHKQILNQNQKMKFDNNDKNINLNKIQIRKKQFHILYQQYKAGIHKLKNLHFYQSSCSEDNDTDQQTIYQRQKKQQEILLNNMNRIIPDSKKNKQIFKLWKLYLDNQQQQSQQQQQQSQQILPTIKNDNLKKQIQSKLYKQQQSSQIQSQQQQQQDQQFLWIDKISTDKTYFIMNTKQIIKQNQQIYNFYGRRSNKFLLTGYNFIIENNIYDSFTFKIKLDPKNINKISASNLLQNFKKKQSQFNSKEIRLKKYRINKDLINICRSYIILWSKKQLKNCKLFCAFNREIQQKTLQLYLQFINHFIKQFTTTLSQDQQQIQQIKKYQQKIAISLRIQYKKILLSQIDLINQCIIFLKRWKIGQIQNIQQNQMIWIKRIKTYLINLQQAITL